MNISKDTKELCRGIDILDTLADKGRMLCESEALLNSYQSAIDTVFAQYEGKQISYDEAISELRKIKKVFESLEDESMLWGGAHMENADIIKDFVYEYAQMLNGRMQEQNKKINNILNAEERFCDINSKPDGEQKPENAVPEAVILPIGSVTLYIIAY